MFIVKSFLVEKKTIYASFSTLSIGVLKAPSRGSFYFEMKFLTSLLLVLGAALALVASPVSAHSTGVLTEETFAPYHTGVELDSKIVSLAKECPILELKYVPPLVPFSRLAPSMSFFTHCLAP